jgi:hypothetical protein
MHVEKKPDDAPILSAPEEIVITKVNYRIHKKNGSPDSLRIDYYKDDLNFISDFLCFDHAAPYARQMAHKKWAMLGGQRIANTYDAYDHVSLLKRPSKMLVKKEDRFYRILQILEWAENAKSESESLFEETGLNI